VDSAIHGVLESGQYILGENVGSFEREFAGYCGARYGVAVASGTSAIHLALRSCGIKKGDEVITVANTAAATVLAILYSGAKPVFSDIDRDTYNMDVSRAEEKISRDTKAIIPVHLFGRPVAMDPLTDLAEDRGLKLVEDACQAHGAEYKGKKAGTFGDVGCFSFYPTKNLGCYGDGGMAITDDGRIAAKLRLLRNYGQQKAYHSLIRGYNSRLDELQAAVLRVKLKNIDEWNEKRRTLARSYNELLAGTGVARPIESAHCKHVYHQYVVGCDKRDTLQRWLKERGVMTNVHYPVPVHLQKAFAGLRIVKGSLPATEENASRILSLPIYPEMGEEQVKAVAGLIRKFYDT
jgi:dTDP-4-amino-4,6-dideoxygalactose transaminase